MMVINLFTFFTHKVQNFRPLVSIKAFLVFASYIYETPFLNLTRYKVGECKKLTHSNKNLKKSNQPDAEMWVIIFVRLA